jgi:hypothetical protein
MPSEIASKLQSGSAGILLTRRCLIVAALDRDMISFFGLPVGDRKPVQPQAERLKVGNDASRGGFKVSYEREQAHISASIDLILPKIAPLLAKVAKSDFGACRFICVRPWFLRF